MAKISKLAGHTNRRNLERDFKKSKTAGCTRLVETIWDKMPNGANEAKSFIASLIRDYDTSTSKLLCFEEIENSFVKSYSENLVACDAVLTNGGSRKLVLVSFYPKPEDNLFIGFLANKYSSLSSFRKYNPFFIRVLESPAILKDTESYVNYVVGVSESWTGKTFTKSYAENVFVTDSVRVAKSLERVSDRTGMDYRIILSASMSQSIVVASELKEWSFVNINSAPPETSDIIDCVHEHLAKKYSKTIPRVFVENCVTALDESVLADDKPLPVETYISFIREVTGNFSSIRHPLKRVIVDDVKEMEEEIGKAIFPLILDDSEEVLVGEETMLVGSQGDENQSQAQSMLNYSFNSLGKLSHALLSKVIGQEVALKKIIDSLTVPFSGINDPKKPLRSFIFAGSTGTGKTMTALALAESVYTKKVPLLRLDMSEYSKDHEVAKLFGSPPGYVGHGEGGILTNHVAENPFSIILLDEIEKADPKIFDSFLQVLDAGRMTTPDGKEVDFTKTIVIMTTNVGVEEKARSMTGFTLDDKGSKTKLELNDEITKKTRTALKQIMRPEFINRIDDIIVFDDLNEDSAKKIVDLEIGKINDRLSSNKTRIDILFKNSDVYDLIIKESDCGTYGARGVQRAFSRLIGAKLAKIIIENMTFPEEHISITIYVGKNGEIKMSKEYFNHADALKGVRPAGEEGSSGRDLPESGENDEDVITERHYQITQGEAVATYEKTPENILSISEIKECDWFKIASKKTGSFHYDPQLYYSVAGKAVSSLHERIA